MSQPEESLKSRRNLLKDRQRIAGIIELTKRTEGWEYILSEFMRVYEEARDIRTGNLDAFNALEKVRASWEGLTKDGQEAQQELNDKPEDY